MKFNKNYKSNLATAFRIKDSVWFFPLIVTVLLLLATTLKIHGSSIGVYHHLLFGETQDTNLLYGEPQTIRSDEWLQWTQYNILESKTDYPVFNEKLGSGRDITKNSESPVKNWVNIFRPGNWSFMILPFEYAFAFKWWLLSYLTLMGAYFFVLRLHKNQYLLASILSISFALSPYILWWYQSPLSLTLAFGFFLMILGIRIIDQEVIPKIKSRIATNAIYILLFAFLLASVALYLYPPYAIPVLFVVAVFLVGHSLQRLFTKKISIKSLLKRSLLFALASLIALTVCVVFIHQHKAMVDAVSNSVYPGKRLSSGGEVGWLNIFDGFLMPFLQDKSGGAQLFSNQPESANYILLLPFLILAGVVIQILRYLKNKEINWVLLTLHVCALLFFSRLLFNFGDFFFNLIYFDRVPGARLMSALGFLGFIYLVVLISEIRKIKLTRNVIYAIWAYSIFMLAFLAYIILVIKKDYPLFIEHNLLAILFAVMFTSIIIALLLKRPLVGATILLVFTVLSSFRIMPLYRGFDVLLESKVLNKIEAVSTPDSEWITTDSIYYLNFPMLAGRGLVDGDQLYPDINYWRSFDNGKSEFIYNRQARMIFTTDKNMKEKMKLVQKNYIQVKFECSEFVKEKADFVLGTVPINETCLKLIDEVDYPTQKFYIYKIDKS